MKYHLTLKSLNRKTGPIPVSTMPSATCPPSCPLRRAKECYASQGHLALHWRALDAGTRGGSWQEFLTAIRSLPLNQIWRHCQAGDQAGAGERLNCKMMGELVSANDWRRGFTYTHKQLARYAERVAVRSANARGFVVNLSANSPSHADQRADLDCGPVVCVVPTGTPPVSYTPAGRKIVICPAQQRAGVTCQSCRLCAQGSRSVIVGFLPHGNRADSVSQIASKL